MAITIYYATRNYSGVIEYVIHGYKKFADLPERIKVDRHNGAIFLNKSEVHASRKDAVKEYLDNCKNRIEMLKDEIKRHGWDDSGRD